MPHQGSFLYSVIGYYINHNDPKLRKFCHELIIEDLYKYCPDKKDLGSIAKRAIDIEDYEMIDWLLDKDNELLTPFEPVIDIIYPSKEGIPFYCDLCSVCKFKGSSKLFK